jgi:hypothetical protein
VEKKTKTMRPLKKEAVPEDEANHETPPLLLVLVLVVD